jgi:hypothetical protein
MPGFAAFREQVRRRRNEMRSARGAPPLSAWTAPPAFAGADSPGWPGDGASGTPAFAGAGSGGDAGPDEWAGEPTEAGQPEVGELQTALQERDAELAEAKRLLGEVTDYAATLENRVKELIAEAEPMKELVAGAEPMAKALLLPGLKNVLVKCFFPDNKQVDDKQKELLTEAMKTINVAYDCAEKFRSAPE